MGKTTFRRPLGPAISAASAPLEIAARTIVRLGVGVDARRFQVGMPEGLADQRDRCALVYGMTGVGMAQPMGGDGGIDSRPLRRRLHNVVDAALRNGEHAADVGASPRKLRKVSPTSRDTLRGLSPLPTMASCTSPVSRGMICDHVEARKLGDAKPAEVGNF